MCTGAESSGLCKTLARCVLPSVFQDEIEGCWLFLLIVTCALCSLYLDSTPAKRLVIWNDLNESLNAKCSINTRSSSLLTLLSLSEQTFMESHLKACFLFSCAIPLNMCSSSCESGVLKMRDTDKKYLYPMFAIFQLNSSRELPRWPNQKKNLAVAAGASRPDGEQCRYGLSHKKKKNNVE